ncbi:STAS domain-containing protein [Peribacillus deserti]|uniref:Anti-anti-sigma factor n=1 Tax=Peribacillus deserti TaxID=673318 RepID=A0A2N5M0U5_9BACI|nr:STAS domain-containing protein [Peribacillus deserti]PLT27903.1 anti-anti-sigma factor [Peribacillus deserti]
MKTVINPNLKTISQKIESQTAELAQQRYHADSAIYSGNVDISLRNWRENIIRIFAQSICDDIDLTYQHLKNWGTDSVNLLVNLDLPLDLAIEEVRFYRDTIGEIIKDEAIKYEFSLEEFYKIISQFDSVLDRAVHWLSMSYSGTFSTRLLAAEATALELSIPVIQISDEVGVLPLVGDIDTKRSQELMDKAMRGASDLQLSYIIIDLSGVPIIDTMVANHIFQVMDALKLVGVVPIMTGIRPEISQTMVHLGIKLEGVSTFASLHKAIKMIEKRNA